MAIWTDGTELFADNYKNRLTIQEKYISISNSTTKDSGEYTVRVTDTNGDSGSFNFSVVVRGESWLLWFPWLKSPCLTKYGRSLYYGPNDGVGL